MDSNLSHELDKLRESDFSFDLTDGQELYICAKKTYRRGSVKWRVGEISSDRIECIEADDKYKQVIVRGCIDLKPESSLRYCEMTNCTVVECSPVNKPKSDIKQYLAELWDMCFSDAELVYYTGSPEASDFKITTSWGQGKAGHMGVLSDDNAADFKLGVNWQVWNRRDSEDKVKFLTHELTHLVHKHHRSSFFIRRTEVVNTLLESEEYRNTVEDWFGDINWSCLKAKVLKEPHNQSSEIELDGERCRLDAVNSLVEELESIIEYDYRAAQRFYLNPPLRELKLGFMDSISESEYQMRSVKSLEFKSEYSDCELNAYIDENLVNPDSYGFKYGLEHIPRVADNDVVSNGEFLQVILKMSRNIPTETSVQIPVISV